jgi:hypothetical protein
MTMITAFPYWRDRIAPTFDTAGTVLLVDCRLGRVGGERQLIFGDDDPAVRVRALQEAQVTSIVCGALSRALQGMLVDAGMEVIPFIAGDLDRVVREWCAGHLDIELFAMPGCRRRRGRFRGGLS